MMKITRYKEIDINVGTIIKIKITIKITPILERRYSILAPAVLSDSPIVPPANGMMWPTSILAVLDDKLSALLAKSVCVEITVEKIIAINPQTNEKIFLMPLLSAKRFTSLTNEEAIVKAIHMPIMNSSEIIQTFSKIDRKTINP